ncbi:uncharacterized protein M6B38_201925 [Iris pallida]|uniref:4a-hydroxytetrahydrobiopterin dehydratase n=1 Tax=Iris pallida TaxID=29817 RepID=A0AAX6E9S4_IRIPA|nr:Uncharacterized protein M6B38_219465 [Iris pallida]KAJ6800774.1 uncharacterized protein M6B38_201925 [Iris pallida]
MHRMVQQHRFFSKVPFLSSTIPFSSHGRSQIFNIHPNAVELLPSRRFSFTFSSCSSSQDLTAKKCAPCDSKNIQPLSEQSAQEMLPKVQGWNLSSEDGTMKLQQSWKVKSFTKGLEFFQLVAEVAEAEGHHPDLHLVGWNNVKIDIWTHAVGGLTENDFILAAKISSLKTEHLLRKKKSADSKPTSSHAEP